MKIKMKKFKLVTSIIVIALSLNIIISLLYVSNASDMINKLNATNITNSINNTTTNTENVNVNNSKNVIVNNSSENLINEQTTQNNKNKTNEETTEDYTNKISEEKKENLVDTNINNISTMSLEHNTREDTKELGIKYQSHVSMVGWQDYVENGETSGIEKGKRRIEAIKVQLTNAVQGASVEYQAHVEDVRMAKMETRWGNGWNRRRG